MKLVLAALRNPHAVIVFMLFLVVVGVSALLRIPADLLPIFKTPAIQVVTLYPGMPPVVVEKDISEIDILDDKKGEDPTRRGQKYDLLRLVTKGLNRNERLIIILYYYEELTMKEIGTTLDLSESRVSQMHSGLVQRLQQQLQYRRREFAA